MKIKITPRNLVILLGFDSSKAGKSEILRKEDVAGQFKASNDANTFKYSNLELADNF